MKKFLGKKKFEKRAFLFLISCLFCVPIVAKEQKIRFHQVEKIYQVDKNGKPVLIKINETTKHAYNPPAFKAARIFIKRLKKALGKKKLEEIQEVFTDDII